MPGEAKSIPSPRSPLREDEIRELIRAAQEGDEKARDKILRHNLALVWHVVKRFRGRGREKDDLFQVGCIGLLKAVDRFDLERGVKFSTYAVPSISGEIKRYLDKDSFLNMSRAKNKLARDVKRLQEELKKELGREPTLGELEDRLQVDREEIVGVLERAQEPLSLFYKVDSDEPNSAELMDLIEGEGNNWFNKLLVRDLLDELPARQKQLLVLRFFKGRIQSEVGDRLGLSQAQISRLERRALKTLRQHLTDGK